jgi:Domain of unknown function (DUF4956)
MSELGAAPFLVLLAAAATSSLLVAVLYQHYFGRKGTGTQIYRAFSLLGLSITAIFVTVQFSLPLSIGLLAALSIVRFRTPIKEPEEIGILMVVVAAAVASATFKLQFLGLLLVATFAALALQRLSAAWIGRGDVRQMVTVTMPAAEYEPNSSAVRDIVERHLGEGRLEALVTSSDEVVVSFSLPGRARPDLEGLRGDLQRRAVAPHVDVHLARARS